MGTCTVNGIWLSSILVLLARSLATFWRSTLTRPDVWAKADVSDARPKAMAIAEHKASGDPLFGFMFNTPLTSKPSRENFSLRRPTQIGRTGMHSVKRVTSINQLSLVAGALSISFTFTYMLPHRII
jgi:hypothetical protein